MLPCGCAVRGFVNTVALHDVAAQLYFTHAGIHDIGIGCADAQSAD
jgi:hypothetical protein